MKFHRLLIITVLISGIIAGCANTDSENNNEGLPKIYTTIYPLQFLVEELAGDYVEAVTIYPPGVDEHTYEPTSKELTDIADGAAFFYIGAGLEAFAHTAADALASQDVVLIEIGENEQLFLHADEDDHDHNHDHHEHDHGDLDPHIWLDPVRMAEIAEIIVAELGLLFPDESESFEENLVEVEDALLSLNQEFEQLIDSKSNKSILVTHAAFGYWEERYGLEQVAIHGVSTENEPSQKALVEIIETAEAHDLEHVIFEQNVSTRVAEVIQEEIGAESLILHNLAVLTEEDITEGRDYLSIMRNNLDVLDEAMN